MNNTGAKTPSGRDCAGSPGPLGGARSVTRLFGTTPGNCRIGAAGLRRYRDITFGFVFLSAFLFPLGLCRALPIAPLLETNPTNVAKVLATADTWLLPQPKA